MSDDPTPIPGWPGYLVDEEGRVYSTWRRIHVRGLEWRTDAAGPPRELPQFDRRSVKGRPTPYRSVKLCRRDARGRSVGRNCYVHELIALTFLGPRPDGLEILHGAEGSGVNRRSNLRYGTPEENSAERVLSRGDDWYRARGICPPQYRKTSAPGVGAAAPPEPAHAFADLIGG